MTTARLTDSLALVCRSARTGIHADTARTPAQPPGHSVTKCFRPKSIPFSLYPFLTLSKNAYTKFSAMPFSLLKMTLTIRFSKYYFSSPKNNKSRTLTLPAM